MNVINSTNLSSFYVVGGTMDLDAPSYIERQADKTLFDTLTRGEFGYVLTARQMGKSSLIVRTAARLRERGNQVAALDLTAIGRNLTPEQWYAGLLAQIGQRLDMQDELLDFWMSRTLLGPMQRWVKALGAVVLPRCPDRLIIFIDEIDAVRSLPFSADEFFAGIRECYNQRVENPDMRRIAFCLSGVASPSDLISDTRTTPFNIGRRIDLNDFTIVEAAALASGLGRARREGMAILRRILYWTNGHPYLTQRLCRTVAENAGIRGATDIDRLCAELFFSPRAQERDDNLLFVRERLLRSEVDVSSLLDLYTKVLERKPVRDDETNPLVNVLRLSGVIRAESGRLRLRNRIYSHVFDRAWVEAKLPDAEVRRQRAAYRRGVWRTASISVAILIVVGSLAVIALLQRNRAERQASLNRRLLYFAEMKNAHQEWELANTSRVEEILQSQIPQQGEEDFRGFEWYLLWRLTHSEIFRLQENLQIAGLTLLPDGRTCVFGVPFRAKQNGESEYQIKIFDWRANRLLSSFKVPAGKNFNLVVFSPDRRFVATDGPDFSVNLWNIPDGTQAALLKGRQRAVTVIAYSLKGDHIASADLDGAVKLWSPSRGLSRTVLKHQRPVTGVAFSPDGRLLVSTDESSAMRIFDIAGQRELPPFLISESVLTRVWFLPDGNMVLLASQSGRLYLCDVRTRRIIKTLEGHTGAVSSFAFSPRNKTFATGGIDNTVRLWDAATWRNSGAIRKPGSEVKTVAWSDDGKYLATGGVDGMIKIWQASAITDPALPDEPVSRYLATTFTPGRELISLGVGKKSQLKLWNLSTGRELARFDEAGDKVICAVFSPDGKLAATGGMDSMIRLWDTYTGKLVRTLRGHKSHVYGINFSPDGKLAVSGGEDRALLLWDIANDLPPVSLKSDVDNSYRAVFSPDGGFLATACRDGSVKLWDVATKQVAGNFVGHADYVSAMAFSPDGKWLVTAGMDNTLRLWDVRTGEGLEQVGQSDSIKRVAFSPDGRRLVTGGTNGLVRLWDITRLREQMTLSGHADEVSSISFSADGALLTTSGADGAVRLWRAAVKTDVIASKSK